MNQQILLAFYNFTSGNATFSALAIFFAEWFPYFFVLVAALCVICHRMSAESKTSLKAFFTRANLRTYAIQLFLTFFPAILAWLAADVIKMLFPVMRPFAALGLTPLVFGENPIASFPSSHATFFAALGVTIYLRDKIPGRWFLLAAFVIGLARIAVGIHWPSDILAGFLLGGVVAFLAHNVASRVGDRLTKSKEVIK